jgi:O-antigen/teichoic acid export membrane protein
MTTSTVSRRLFTGSAFQTLNYVAQVAVVFFLMPFIVRSLGDRLYGLWSLVGAVIGYYGLLDFGLSMTVNRFMAKSIGADDREESNDIFNAAFFVFFGIGIVVLLATGILFVLATTLFKDPSDASLFSKVILIVGVNMAIDFPLRVYGGALGAKLRYDIVSLIQMLTLAVRTALTVLVLVLGYGLLALVWVTVLSSALSKILSVYYSKKNMPHLRLQFSRWKARKAKMLFSYSSFAFLSKLSDELRFNIDVVVITAFLGLATVTHYKIASTMALYFRTLVMSMLGIFLPLFSQQHGAGDYEALKKSFFFCSKLAICISGFIGFGFVVWGRPFIQRWMGPEYLDAYPVLVVLTVACAVDMAQAASPAYLFATSNHRLFSFYGMAEGIFNVLLSLVLVKPYGMMGVALGTLVPLLAVKLVIQPLHVCKILSISYAEYAKTMMMTLLRVSVALIIPTLVSVAFVAPDYRNLFLISASSVGAYTLVIWLIELTRNEKKMLLRAAAPRFMIKSSVE